MITKPIRSIPIPEDANQVERWWLTVRDQTFRTLPLETALSIPVPALSGERVILHAFYYGVQRGARPGLGKALPPIARVAASYPEGKLLFFQHRRMGELFPGLPDLGPQGELTRPGMSVQERMQARKALFLAYEKVIDSFCKQADVRGVQDGFKELFLQVVEPGLKSYYHALNPAFFRWLDELGSG